MRKTTYSIILILLLVITVASCNQENTVQEEPAKISLNPNGDSELALLMRSMYDEADRIKKQIANKEPVTISLDHEKILSAHATEPKKAASPEFKTFAKAYLETVNKFEGANHEESIVIYESLIKNCLDCHKSVCPGPIVKINKLKKKSF